MCLVYSAPSNIKIDDFVSRIFTESNALASRQKVNRGELCWHFDHWTNQRCQTFFFLLSSSSSSSFFLNPVGLDLTFLV